MLKSDQGIDEPLWGTTQLVREVLMNGATGLEIG